MLLVSIMWLLMKLPCLRGGFWYRLLYVLNLMELVILLAWSWLSCRRLTYRSVPWMMLIRYLFSGCRYVFSIWVTSRVILRGIASPWYSLRG